ncbi:MAG: glutamate--tRNA ligase [Dehalococcoidia bacterium]|nr:glutamate--tRNA ligase [Dehalococcoidia bacterium]MSQ16861.1 glutamate--tRNA ligase [Dehalococcoidia bacterium]
MTTPAVRVRYAPSPTGQPHIGTVRTALFNWLFARHHGGKFIVRVEDTDQERLVPGSQQNILESLKWLGIQWDEGPEVDGPFAPYIQSERQKLGIYHRAAEQLIRGGNAYRCYCTREQLEQVRTQQREDKVQTRPKDPCSALSHQQRRDREAEGAPSVVRFAMPSTGTTSVQDLIRGEVTWQNEVLDDFIIIKSDGFPTYHLANVVDDHLMDISHVLRAEEWLPSTPRHVQLYRALEYAPPLFGHMPMILGPDRSKLSKRHGATSALEYRDNGYLPEALRNFMVLLGWSLDDKSEVMSLDTMVQNFTLERVSKPAAIFDQEKLLWMNGVYLRQFSHQELASRMLPFLERDLDKRLLPVDMDYLRRIAPLIQERIKLLSDAADLTSYFFQSELEYDSANLVQKGMDQMGTLAAFRRALPVLTAAPGFTHSVLDESLRAAGAELGLSPRQFFGVLRVAVTGRTATPPLFETMEVLGRQRVLGRLHEAIGRLSPA